MKVIQFTHTDLDGVVCSIVASTFFSDIETYSINYNQIDDLLMKVLKEQKESCLIIISDLSYSHERVDITNELLRNHTTLIADHHKSALWLNELNSDKFIVSVESDGGSCGAEVLYKLLKSRYKFDETYSKEKLYKLLEITSKWDTWSWSKSIKFPIHKNEALYYSNAYSVIGFDRFLNRILRWLLFDFVKSPFTKTDLELIDSYNNSQEDNIKEVLSRGSFKFLKVGEEKFKVLYLVDEKFHQSIISLVANQEFPKSEYDYDFILIEEPHGYSLRYGNSIDLSEIAEYFGGGGHFDAAGFSKEDFDKNNLLTD